METFEKCPFLFKIKACEKNNHPVEVPGQAGICVIFRGLFFEHNEEIGQKGAFCKGLKGRKG
jgi:hypothetical protein